ncbi:MAG: hypothetical protein GXY76_23300 [Chloroflexi bacterium]|nr:hypothetical protein [Chloroflexota bacterium]
MTVPWYEKQLRILHASLGFARNELPTVDLVAFARDVKAQNYNAQHVEYSVSWDGENRIFLFQTDQARAVPRDVLKEYLPEAHKLGIKVFIYVNVHWANKSFIEERPEWVQRKVDGEPLTGMYGGKGTAPCVNTSYLPWIAGLIEEMGSKYPIDGIFLDGPCFYVGTCYCPDCQRLFRERYGVDIREVTTEQHPHWPDFVQFRYDSITHFNAVCREALHKHVPGAPLYMNANGLHSGRWNGRSNRTLIPSQDILGAEGGFIFYGKPMDVPLWKVSGTAKYLEAQARGKPTVIFTAVGHKPWEYPLTAPEIKLNTAATFAAGANPWLGGYQKDLHDPSLIAVADELGFFARHEEALSGTASLAETALLWSEDTADYYGAHMPEIDFIVDRPQAKQEFDYQSSFSGGYEALLRTNTPFAVVDNVGVEAEGALRGMRTLLLTDAACMSAATAAAIREWVRAGGTLVATANSSLYDERGRQRDDFLLADVFGASYVGPRGLSGWDQIQLSAAARARHGLAREDIPSPTYQLRVRALPGAEVAARYYEPTESRYSGKPDVSADPAMLYQRYGQGQCLYIAGSAARHYWTYRIDEWHKLLTFGALESPLLQVLAPSPAVEAILRQRKGGSDWVVHLLNYTGGMERPIKRIVELGDVAIRLRQAKDPARAEALRAGVPLRWRREGDYVVLTLPKLTHHEAIHIVWA